MKNLKPEINKTLRLTWLICLALCLEPLTAVAKDSTDQATKKAAERLKENFDTIAQFESAAKKAADSKIFQLSMKPDRLFSVFGRVANEGPITKCALGRLLIE
jgi:hypothetical protein